MFSSTLPAGNPHNLPVYYPTGTALTAIKSAISGSAPAILSLPGTGPSIDGVTFALFVAGRLTLNSGATPGNFNCMLELGLSVATRIDITSVNENLPAIASKSLAFPS